MFCKNCGKELQDGVKFCPYCGTDNSFGGEVKNAANATIRSAENEIHSAVYNVQNEFANNGQNGSINQVQRLQADRSLPMYILLTIITCGIYAYYFVYKMAHDVNIACQGDGEETSGLVMYILLSIVTCGIYNIVWEYKLGNRLASNANKYGLSFQENGTTILMWRLFGSLLCGIGPFIAMHIMIKNTNLICQGYNRANNL